MIDRFRPTSFKQVENFLKMDRKRQLISLIWIIAISLITVFGYAPEHLNADILMNSVMSVQHLTLFYWGQNRLLNVLPFLVSFIPDPATNLYSVLIVSSIVYNASIFAVSKSIVRVFGGPASDAALHFVLLSSFSVLVFKRDFLAEMAIGHIEYSLAFLLVSSAIYIEWFSNKDLWIRRALSLILIFVAMGVNPSVLALNMIFLLLVFLHNRKVESHAVAVIAFSICSLVAWSLIAKSFGPIEDYGKFNPMMISEGLGIVMGRFISAIRWVVVFVLLCSWLVWRLRILITEGSLKRRNLGLEEFIVFGALLFFFIWVLLFSANKWVSINQFMLRYFIFAVYACLVVAGIGIMAFLRRESVLIRYTVVCLFAISAVAVAYRKPVGLLEYGMFKNLERFGVESKGLYAGDYWVVWPAVYKELIMGKVAYGLAYRAEGNRNRVNEYVKNEISRTGSFRVCCLNDTPEACAEQVRNTIGPVSIKSIEYKRDSVTEIVFMK